MITRNIFISSTIYDLKKERSAIKDFFESTSTEHVRLNAVMSDYPETFILQPEDFTTNSSYRTCLNKISLCSYYLLIINKRYNLRKELDCDISITHQEYKEARKQHLPCMVFINDKTIKAKHEYKTKGTQNYVSDNQLQIFDFIDEISSQKQNEANWTITYKDSAHLIKLLSATIYNFDDSVFITAYPNNDNIVEFNEEFSQTWVIRNNGNKVWEKRFLRYENHETNFLIAASNLIEIPTTLPGEEVHLTAKFKAPKFQAVYRAYWKMVDADGVYCFPHKQGLGVNVKVVQSRLRGY